MNRRRFLRTAGVAGLTGGGSFAGCVSNSLSTPPTTDDAADAGPGDWPTFGADRANTGHIPDAVGPTDASVVWTFDAGSPTANTSPVVVGETVYTGSSGTDGNLYALDAASAELRWEFDTAGWVNHAPAFADGTVYVGSDSQVFHAVDAATGEERWRTDLKHDLHESSPTVVEGTVYVGTAGNSPAVASDDSEVDRTAALFALDAATGEKRWQFDVADWISTTPAVVGSRVFFGDDTGRVGRSTPRPARRSGPTPRPGGDGSPRRRPSPTAPSTRARTAPSTRSTPRPATRTGPSTCGGPK